MVNNFTFDIGKVLDSYIGNYDNFLINGDWTLKLLKPQYMNSTIVVICIVYVYLLKNPGKPSFIDLFLTNSPRSFQNTKKIEMGLSDLHKLVVKILELFLPNNQPKVITYRDYQSLDNSRLLFWGVSVGECQTSTTK